MRRVSLLCAVLLAACASSPGGSSAAPDQTVRIPTNDASGGATMRINASAPPASIRPLRASPDRVWAALPSVFEALGLPITDRDAASRTIGSSQFKVRRRLGDTPLSRYIDCGSTQGAPSAETYEILLSLSSRILGGTADSASVSTVLSAQGRPVVFSGEYVNCGTKNELEKKFFDVLNTKLRP